MNPTNILYSKIKDLIKNLEASLERNLKYFKEISITDEIKCIWVSDANKIENIRYFHKCLDFSSLGMFSSWSVFRGNGNVDFDLNIKY